jgi:hypothetical protein
MLHCRLEREHLHEPFNFLFSDTTTASVFVTIYSTLEFLSPFVCCEENSENGAGEVVSSNVNDMVRCKCRNSRFYNVMYVLPLPLICVRVCMYYSYLYSVCIRMCLYVNSNSVNNIIHICHHVSLSLFLKIGT